MASSNDTVIIKFEAQGDKSLVTAIKALDRATKSMINTQASMADFQKKGFQATEKGKASYIRLKNTMLSYDKTLRDVTKDEQLLALAKKGDTVATMKLSRAIKKYTRDLDRNKKSIIGTTHDTRILGGSFAVLRSKMLIVAFAAGLLERSFVGLVRTFSKQEAVDQKLRAGLANIADTTTGVTQRLLDYSSALQQTTAFGDELITNGMTQLTTFGLNEKSIKSLTPQVLNVARAIQTTSGSMPDLNSLFIAFGKSTSTAVSALTRYGVVLTDSEKKQLEAMDANERAVEIAKILDRQYGGLAEAYAKTTAGMLDGAAAARGDAAEAFGEVLAPSVLKVSEALKIIAESATPQNIKILGTAAGVAAVGMGLLSLAAWASAAGLTSFSAMLVAAQASLVSFSATAIVSTGGIWAIGIALGATALAALKYFGAYETGEKVLTDSVKKTNEFEKAIRDKGEALGWSSSRILLEIEAMKKRMATEAELKVQQDAGELSLQKQLDLLNATSEAEKMLINLGHEASDAEKVLITQIVAKNAALSTQEAKLEAVARAEKARAKAMKATITQAAKLKKANKDIIQAELNKTITQQKENLEALVLQIRKTIKYTTLSADELIKYTEALNNVSQSLANLGNTGDDVIEKLSKEDSINLLLNQASAASSAYSSFVQGTVTADINALKARDSYQNASMEQRQTMEEGVRKKHEKALKRAALAEKAGAIASATMNTYTAYTEALPNVFLANAVAALGAIQITSIMATPTAYAKGGDFVTNKPEMIMVGEAGREHVTITPIDRPESRALKDGGGLTINIQGGIVDQSYVSNELIPAINKATSLGVTLA